LWDAIANLDFSVIGFGIIAIFFLSWAISTLVYRWKGYDDLPVSPAPLQGASTNS
jgi:high-affinity nickel-transport protein